MVGIDHYDHIAPLFGCVNDAHEVKAVLAHHGSGEVNFECKLLTGTANDSAVTRGHLKDSLATLFASQAEIALFYFAGHGHIENTGGYLLTSDSTRGDEGVPLADILTFAVQSRATNKIIILDSCHAGIAGNAPITNQLASLAEGMTVLTATTAEQYATEEQGRGLFTTLMVDALYGSAANLTGEITPGSVYAHIDQSLGAWTQRPVFKTNVKQFVSLRRVPPHIPLDELRMIADLFPSAGFQFELDPSFEPEMKGRDEGMPSPNPSNTAVLRILQKYNRFGLLVPVDAPHLWNATMESKSCRLTALGEHYRRLAETGRI